jgi:prepilin-type N-terminal cleavage/methylation domain-containing protein
MISKKYGFTMIELLVVTTIVILLTTIGLVSYRQVGINARNGKRKTDLETVRQALVLYRVDEGSYPNTSNFSTMLSTATDYISAENIADPKNEAPYVYAYSSDGVTFTLQARLEPDNTAYTLSNP